MAISNNINNRYFVGSRVVVVSAAAAAAPYLRNGLPLLLRCERIEVYLDSGNYQILLYTNEQLE